MEMTTHEFAPRPALVRRAIEKHAKWIEKILGLPISQTVTVECDLSLIDAATPQLIGTIGLGTTQEKPLLRFAELLESAETPPSCAPLLQADVMNRPADLEEVLGGTASRHSYSLRWDDCPVSFRV